MYYQGNALPKRKCRFWLGLVCVYIVILALVIEAWGHGEGQCDHGDKIRHALPNWYPDPGDGRHRHVYRTGPDEYVATYFAGVDLSSDIFRDCGSPTIAENRQGEANVGSIEFFPPRCNNVRDDETGDPPVPGMQLFVYVLTRGQNRVCFPKGVAIAENRDVAHIEDNCYRIFSECIVVKKIWFTPDHLLAPKAVRVGTLAMGWAQIKMAR